ncbi:vomeronasal type-1 receptor 100-like isoform X5 [Panthera tigris]|uniref:vomeronasal type-1 receptor 100-like isoform X5 n=1 Tax=Panthera tigris TaxID=9694 RepID=UPI001C6F8C77|nr:vomeronasal type-1 receptor 100-like isoform X5 [Panthera tigris]
MERKLVGRGVSIGSISILSVYQAITISPGNSRHKKQVQHIRRTNASSASSPESRATKTILLLRGAACSRRGFLCIDVCAAYRNVIGVHRVVDLCTVLLYL